MSDYPRAKKLARLTLLFLFQGEGVYLVGPRIGDDSSRVEHPDAARLLAEGWYR